MNSPIRLHLVRHGEVEERYQRVFGGRIDMELSPRGRAQAQSLANYLRRIPLEAIYASPMKRVQQTLAPLLAQTERTPTVLPGLREVDFGAWTGLNWEQVKERFNLSAFSWLELLESGGIADAEPSAKFRDRVEGCLRQMLGECPNQSVAVICHGGVIRMILSILLDLPLRKMAGFDFDYASVSTINYRPGKTEVDLLNFRPWRNGE